jgi:hypothetical protein
MGLENCISNLFQDGMVLENGISGLYHDEMGLETTLLGFSQNGKTIKQ